MHPMLTTAFKAARKAGDLILRSLERLDTINPTLKGRHDFVTDIDKKAEKDILAVLQKAYPDHTFLGEETGQHRGQADCVWIIDPLDGTHNYLRGLPHFSISIAFQYKGKIQHGLVYDPIRQELFTATRGEGARLNDRRLRVSSTLHLDKALIGTGFPVRQPVQLPEYLACISQLVPKISNLRCSGSAALDLCYVAAGRLDSFIEIGLHIWDIAAGSLIIKEAGGLVGDWQGGEHYLEKGSIIAANPKIFSLLYSAIASEPTGNSSLKTNTL